MSMDFGMDRCLQSITHQSHSVDADWIVKYRRATPTCPTCVQNFCSVLFLGLVTQNLHHSYRSIPEHCDLQTAISNCLGYIIFCPQMDLTLPYCSSLPLHTIVTDQFVPKETQKIAGLQLFRTQNICNGLTGDVLKIVLILCT